VRRSSVLASAKGAEEKRGFTKRRAARGDMAPLRGADSLLQYGGARITNKVPIGTDGKLTSAFARFYIAKQPKNVLRCGK
jgi:hypothetical protein